MKKQEKKLSTNFEITTSDKQLVIANKALAMQIADSEKRAAELIIANKELAFQNQEKENRAAELVIANKELAFQNQEKENRAAELLIANKELAFQNQEKEKRAAELLIANKELESFTFISSHDLQEPLRKIQTFSDRILTDEKNNLSSKSKHYFERIQNSALHMQTLINDLLAYSRTSNSKKVFEKINLSALVQEVKMSMQEELNSNAAKVELLSDIEVTVISFQFKQLLQNLFSNSIKFANSDAKLQIRIAAHYISKEEAIVLKLPQNLEYAHISLTDNGIGFESKHSLRIFELFQRLHDKKEYQGTGIGLTIVKKIIENHNGTIFATGKLNEGAQFDIYLPKDQIM